MKPHQAVLIALAVLGACAGSQSESPWPVEPVNAEPELVGEAPRKGNVIDVSELPNRYGAGGGRPTDDEALEDKAREREEKERERDGQRVEKNRREKAPSNDPTRPRSRTPMTP